MIFDLGMCFCMRVDFLAQVVAGSQNGVMHACNVREAKTSPRSVGSRSVRFL